jgi:hypothetical protein
MAALDGMAEANAGATAVFRNELETSAFEGADQGLIGSFAEARPLILDLERSNRGLGNVGRCREILLLQARKSPRGSAEARCQTHNHGQ